MDEWEKNAEQAETEAKEEASVEPVCTENGESVSVEAVQKAVVPEEVQKEAAPEEAVPEREQAEAVQEKTEEPTEESKEEPTEPLDAAMPEAAQKQKADAGSIVGILIGFLVLIAIAAYAWMNPIGKVADTGVLYAKDDALYFYDLKNDPYLVEKSISDGGMYHYYYTAWGATVTEDGNYLYFSAYVDENGKFDLCRRDAKNPDATTEVIDQEVYDYMASKDGKTVAYLKENGDAYDLYVYDGAETQKVAEGIALEDNLYSLSGNGDYLVYTDANGILQAVKVGADMQKNTVPLTDSAETYALAEESGLLYYVAAGENGYDIYSYDFEGNFTVVAENVSAMELLPNGRDLLYSQKSEEKVLYRDVIQDDLAETDAAMTETDADYEKKLERDKIREAMERGEGFDPILQKCYLLTGGKRVLLTEQAIVALGITEDNAYVAGYQGTATDPIPISSIDGGTDMVEYMYYMNIGYGGMSTFLADPSGKLTVLQGTLPQADSVQLSGSKNKAAYLDTDAATGETILVEMDLQKEKAETIAENVQSFGYVGNTLIYYYDYADGSGTLGVAGSETTVANASGAQFTEDAVYYIADLDETSGNGRLAAWNGKTEQTIAEDAFMFYYKENGKLVYIGSYDLNKAVGDLYYYDGKQTRKLDTDVTAIFIY